MSYYNYENGLNDRIKYGAIVGTAIALIFYVISLIINTSPTSPKEDTTTKTLTNTISNK